MAADLPVPGPEDRAGSIPTLSFLLVTYNSLTVLPGFIASLKQHPPVCDWELIVVDNASNDGAADYVATEFNRARIIRSDRNRGFAWGVNRAASDARGDYYCLVNPDIVWNGRAIDALMDRCGSNDRIGAVTPQLLSPDGRPQLSVRRFPTHRNIWMSRGVPWPRWLRRLLGPDTYTQMYPSEPVRIEAAAAACLLVRATAFRDVGGFDDAYFMYVEDTDFCRRLYDHGWEVWCDPTVTVQHQWGQGSRRSRIQAAHHRAGIRRYFQTHHSDKPIRNAVLFLVLKLAGAFDWMYIRQDRGARDV
ncbi:MAG: glycosyltransferase family 2 protein [Candidatus Zixiibacteriota bacterium]